MDLRSAMNRWGVVSLSATLAMLAFELFLLGAAWGRLSPAASAWFVFTVCHLGGPRFQDLTVDVE